LIIRNCSIRVFVILVNLILLGCSESKSSQLPAIDVNSIRIVSLAPNLTELAFHAGAGKNLVGVVEHSDYPREAILLPRVGDAFRIDFELLRLLDPDLILVWGSGNPKEMQARLIELGYELLIFEPQSLEDVADHLRIIGAHAGTADIAETAALDYLSQLDEIWNLYGAEPDTRVFYQITASPFYTVNGDHVISQILKRCGGRNIFEDIPVIAGAVSLESILSSDPEIIIASVASLEDIEWQEQWNNFEGMAAVQSQAFVSVNRDEISRSSTRLADGARQICKGLSLARN
jgi:iron complex transport system substrate-binding protein